MFKGIFFSCPHYTEQPPVMRRDGYGTQILTKIEYLVSWASGTANLFCCGDLFHRKANTSIREVKLMAEVLARLKNPMYMILGNHDIQGYNQNIDTQPVGVLVSAGLVKLVPEEGIKFGDGVIVTGASYRSNYEEMEPYSVAVPSGFDLHIHMTHGVLTPTQMQFESTPAKDVDFSADILVNGHWHQYWDDKERGIYNVGSLARVAMVENEINKEPKVLSVDYNGRGKPKCQMVPVAAEKDVWVSEMKRETLNAEDVEKFVAEIREMEIENDEKALEVLLKDQPEQVKLMVARYLGA